MVTAERRRHGPARASTPPSTATMPPCVGRPALPWPALGFWRLALLGLAALALSSHAAKLGQRDFKPLSSKAISTLVSSPDPVRNIDPHNPSSHLSKILIPRPPDTENNTLVREYIVSTLKKLKWHIEEDSFNDTTPYGVKRFTNIIATKDPKAPRRVIVAAHFDSKFFSTYPANQVRLKFLYRNVLPLTRLEVVCRCNRLRCAMRIHA